MIPLAGLNKADVLAALYNASKPQGMGFIHYDPKPMTRQEAEALLKQTTYFDYLKGRVMKVDLSGDTLDPRLYDRDNGQGAAQKAVEALIRSGDTNPSDIQAAHHINTLESAEDVKAHLDDEVTTEEFVDDPEFGKTKVFRLGLSDVKNELGPKVDEAIRRRRQ